MEIFHKAFEAYSITINSPSGSVSLYPMTGIAVIDVEQTRKKQPVKYY